MTKEEFLRTLRGRIAGNMPQQEVESQISYYASYIDSLTAGGMTEEEATESLGDPLLIAKTLGNAVEGGYLDADYQYDGNTTYQSDYQDGADSGNGPERYTGEYEQWTGTAGRTTGGSGDNSGRKTKGTSKFSAWFQTTWLGRKYQEWEETGRLSQMKAVAVLVAALVVAIACIVLFFVACFQVGGCILGGLFPIIIAIILGGLIFSLLRR